jgi:hypothetical protein
MTHHPIAVEALDHIDVMSVKKEGSVVLFIVTTGKLEADEETEKRLLKKINNYLDYINSDEFLEEFGKPNPSRVMIEISCRKEPSKEVLEILENIKPQVEAWQASLTYVVSL